MAASHGAELGAPVTLGASRVRRLRVPGFAVADLRFPGGLTLGRHDHDRATLAVVTEGAFDCWWNGREASCGPGTLLLEPAGELHANRFARRTDTRVIIIQPDGELLALRTAGSHGPRRRPDALPLAWHVAEELRSRDDVTPMALEGLALELAALAARDVAITRPESRLASAAAILEERYAQPITLSALAAELELHPGYLARRFRQQHGRSVGTFLREVRVRRAAERIARGDETLAQVALAVGFADQSHLTRWFTRSMGISPARYRRAILDS